MQYKGDQNCGETGRLDTDALLHTQSLHTFIVTYKAKKVFLDAVVRDTALQATIWQPPVTYDDLLFQMSVNVHGTATSTAD